jgi:hypothetical protein
MADKTAVAAIARYEAMLDEQRRWLPHWQELADYIQPRKSNIAVQRQPGAQQTELLFDSTAPHANELLAASMQGSLTSESFRWFSYRIKGVTLNRDHELNKLLEAAAEDSYDALSASNFASESHEVYLDLPCFGIGALFVEEADLNGSLRFTALSPGTYAIEENEFGAVEVVARKIVLPARAAAVAFPEDQGPTLRAALASNPSERIEYLHLIYPRHDAARGRFRLPASKKPIGSVYVNLRDRITVRESGYDEMPVMVPRWTKASGETYGRGPGTVALPDIKTLNKAVELALKAWAKIVNPPVKVRDEGVIGTVRLMPGGITYVRDMDAIQLLDLGGRLDVADLKEDKLRESIRRIFFSDQLQLQQGPQMTAYEVQVRYELMQRILGPTLGRLTKEFLNPLIERIFWIRFRASEPGSPYRQIMAWAQAHGVVLDIEYEGPLAKAQRLQESIAMQRFWQIVLPLSQVKPEVMDIIDLDAMVRDHARSVGVPSLIIRNEDDVKQIREARIKAQEQQAAMDQAVQASKAASNVAPLLAATSKLGQGTGVVPPDFTAAAGGLNAT